MFNIILKSFSGIDGTTAVAMSETGTGMSGIISTNGQNMSAITQLLAQQNTKTVLDGNNIRVTQGSVSGLNKVSELAKEFKGAMLGVATGSISDITRNTNDAISGGAFTLRPSGNSLQARITIIGADPKANILTSMAKAAAKAEAEDAADDTEVETDTIK